MNSAERKASPVYSGVMAYFPRALMAISRVSRAGNEKHNPGEPLHWSKDKSVDQPDCVARHNLTPYQVDEDSGERHFVHAGWRQLAWIELCFEAVELGLVTWEQLDRGEIAAEQLGKMIVQRRGVKELTQVTEEMGGYETEKPVHHAPRYEWSYTADMALVVSEPTTPVDSYEPPKKRTT